MKIVKLYILAAITLMAGITTLKAQTADEILEKHVKAVGGMENWNKVKTVKMTGTMSVQGMDITLTETLETDKAVRMDISTMGMSGFTIITPTQGWIYMPMQGITKLDTMKPDMVKSGQRQMALKSNQLVDYKTSGDKAEYVGKDTVNSVNCYKIKITDKDGNESTSFFDMATYYLLRTETKLKQDDQETEVAVIYNNYKKTDEGIVLPMSLTASGAEIVYKSIEINKPLEHDIFVPKIDAK